MAQLRQDYEKIKGLNTEVIAVGPEDSKHFNEFWDQHGMPFIGIPDPEHKIARLYKQQVRLTKLGRLPALFIIDLNGLVRVKHYGASMSDIPEDNEVISVLEKLNREHS